MLLPDGTVLNLSRLTGSRAATRVRIHNPNGSCFNGRVGIVVNVWPGPNTVFVRLGATVLPFALSECEVLRD